MVKKYEGSARKLAVIADAIVSFPVNIDRLTYISPKPRKRSDNKDQTNAPIGTLMSIAVIPAMGVFLRAIQRRVSQDSFQAITIIRRIAVPTGKKTEVLAKSYLFAVSGTKRVKVLLTGEYSKQYNEIACNCFLIAINVPELKLLGCQKCYVLSICVDGSE